MTASSQEAYRSAASEFDREAAIRETVDLMREMDDIGVKAIHAYARAATAD